MYVAVIIYSGTVNAWFLNNIFHLFRLLHKKVYLHLKMILVSKSIYTSIQPGNSRKPFLFIGDNDDGTDE